MARYYKNTFKRYKNKNDITKKAYIESNAKQNIFRPIYCWKNMVENANTQQTYFDHTHTPKNI